MTPARQLVRGQQVRIENEFFEIVGITETMHDLEGDMYLIRLEADEQEPMTMLLHGNDELEVIYHPSTT